MANRISVFSEIGKLNSVILHRPGKELLNVVPSIMEELLFDEVPYLERAQLEHDKFAEILRENGVEVKYIEDLATESITNQDIRDKFVETYLSEIGLKGDKEIDLVRKYLSDIKDNKALIEKMIEGIRLDEIGLVKKVEGLSLKEIFAAEPMPNLYFSRDAFALIGHGVCMNRMWSNIRQRETIFGDLVFNNHPDFRDNVPEFWYNKDKPYTLEGGDLLVLSDKVMAIGISQRTDARSIMLFAEKLLSSGQGFEKVLCLNLPKTRAAMHLDTVFTMIDKDLFTVYPGIEENLDVYEIAWDGKELKTTSHEGEEFKKILEKALGVEGIQFIKEGQRGLLDASREQWSDGYNTLAIAPREVVVYERNTVTNELLEKHGAKIHSFYAGELSRGRGGPRCMSMPINRDKLD